ncbi:unnamed protein product [Amoebophrya sp. A25]|nr:unnamed protein product [Amoebophrya sp. A25]|eukprot:GSA25T00025477001.1
MGAYRAFSLHRFPVQTLHMTSVLISGALFMLPALITTGAYIPLGLNPKVLALTGEVLRDAIGWFLMMPLFTDMVKRFAPKGREASTFAMMSFLPTAAKFINKAVSSGCIELLGITATNFDHITLFICMVSASNFLPCALVAAGVLRYYDNTLLRATSSLTGISATGGASGSLIPGVEQDVAQPAAGAGAAGGQQDVAQQKKIESATTSPNPLEVGPQASSPSSPTSPAHCHQVEANSSLINTTPQQGAQAAALTLAAPHERLPEPSEDEYEADPAYSPGQLQPPTTPARSMGVEEASTASENGGNY